jgi:hypothetical protein
MSSCGPVKFAGACLANGTFLERPRLPEIRYVAPCQPYRGPVVDAEPEDFPWAPAKRMRLTAETDEEVKRQRFIRLWKVSLEKHFASCPLCKEFLMASDPLGSLTHTFHMVSPSTFSVRYWGMMSFVKWCQRSGVDVEFSEDRWYSFASAYHTHCTTVASAISSLNFVGGFTRMQELIKIAASKRIIGASSET